MKAAGFQFYAEIKEVARRRTYLLRCPVDANTAGDRRHKRTTWMETSFGHSYRRPLKKRSEIFIDILRQEQELIALKTIPTENRRLLNLMVLARTKYMIADLKKKKKIL